MESNKRVKLLRKTLGLTLQEFGGRLGVSYAAISQIETGKTDLSNRMVLSICREYGVSEEWLRNGVGEMFLPVSRSEKISAFVGELLKDESASFKRQLIEVLSELDESDWETLAKIAKKIKH